MIGRRRTSVAAGLREELQYLINCYDKEKSDPVILISKIALSLSDHVLM